MQQRTLNIKQLAAYLEVSERTIHRMIEDGRMPVKPLEAFVSPRWSVAMIDAWLRGEG